VKAVKDGKTFEDVIYWNYTNDRLKSKKSNVEEKSTEHIGL
jgi:hypothetical protein